MLIHLTLSRSVCGQHWCILFDCFLFLRGEMIWLVPVVCCFSSHYLHVAESLLQLVMASSTLTTCSSIANLTSAILRRVDIRYNWTFSALEQRGELQKKKKKIFFTFLNFGRNSCFLPKHQNRPFGLLVLTIPDISPPWVVSMIGFPSFLLYLFWLNL